MRNVENAMQQPFASLFRDWAVSMVQDDSCRKDLTVPGQLKRPYDEKVKAQQANAAEFGPFVQTLTGAGWEFTLASTSLKYFIVPARTANQHVRVQADKDARLQVTLVPLDPRAGVLELHCRPAQDGLHLEATSVGGPVRLERVVWEKLAAGGTDTDSIGTRKLAVDGAGPLLKATAKWSQILSDVLPAQRDCDLLVRLVGRDELGKTVVGWDLVKARRE